MIFAVAIALAPPQADAAGTDPLSDCLVRKAPTAALALASSEPNAPDEAAALQRLQPSLKRCGAQPPPSNELAVAAFRGGIARRLARELQAEAGPNSNPNFSPNLFTVDRGFDHAVAMQPAYRLANCVVAIDFNGAARLVDTAPGSQGERGVLGALAADLSACVDRGRQMTLPPPQLRTAIDVVFIRRLTPVLRLVLRRR